jgi:hypothetical protein
MSGSRRGGRLPPDDEDIEGGAAMRSDKGRRARRQVGRACMRRRASCAQTHAAPRRVCGLPPAACAGERAGAASCCLRPRMLA